MPRWKRHVISRGVCGVHPGFGLVLIWTGGAYTGLLMGWVKAVTGCVLQIVKRSDDQKGFVVLPKRCIVERTFSWFGRQRRLGKHCEEDPQSSKTMIQVGMIEIMLKRLEASSCPSHTRSQYDGDR